LPESREVIESNGKGEGSRRFGGDDIIDLKLIVDKNVDYDAFVCLEKREI